MPQKNIGQSLLDFAYRSAVETDRAQSYNWWWATPNNSAPTNNPHMNVFEGNPLVAGTTIDNFDQAVSLSKHIPKVIDGIIPNKTVSGLLKAAITAGEIYNVINNSKSMKKKYQLPQEIVLDFEWEF